jgi:hypothetical protein
MEVGVDDETEAAATPAKTTERAKILTASFMGEVPFTKIDGVSYPIPPRGYSIKRCKSNLFMNITN